jgi:hypothetical protein
MRHGPYPTERSLCRKRGPAAFAWHATLRRDKEALAPPKLPPVHAQRRREVGNVRGAPPSGVQ